MLATTMRPVTQPFKQIAPSQSSTACRRRPSSTSRCAATTEHARYITEVAVIPGESPNIDPLVCVLQAQGQNLVAPSDRSQLHPLLVPLAAAAAPSSSSSSSSDQSSATDANPCITCLLRWPERHTGMELPVVSMRRGDRSLTLLARTPQEYLHRALAEEDFNAADAGRPVAEAAGAIGAELYENGAVERSGLPSLAAYLARRAGLYPDICEALALAHFAKGDTMSGLITAEWYMRQGHFNDWGRPYEFACGVLQKNGHPEESRDMARIALRTPWWSLQEGYEKMRDAAEMSAQGADALRAALEEQDEMANGGALQGKFRTNPKSDKQKRLDEVAHLLNRAAAGEVSWDDVRGGVAGELAAAGLAEVARFVELA